MKNYYLLKKDGNEYKFNTKAEVYEMYDCIGRGEVVIEHHLFDTDANGTEKEHIHTAHRITRKILKSGEIRYYIKYVEGC